MDTLCTTNMADYTLFTVLYKIGKIQHLYINNQCDGTVFTFLFS
jgi:hypothetical protein